MSDVAVVIPFHKATPSDAELLSLERCRQVLHRYPTFFVCPEGLPLDRYQIGGDRVEAVRFSPSFFRTVADYDRLMLSRCFYRAFVRYRYILIHQLDAFVFSDELSDWCRQGYDYVGAPWVGADWLDDFRRLWPRWARKNSVGNGGFSLRRTRTFLALLWVFRRAAATWRHHEDGFWSFFVPSYYPLFRIPREEVALRFSFELEPARCFAMTGGRLPFGCHAWEKYDADFWRAFIPAARERAAGR